MHILIAAFDWGGHHATYIENIAKAFVEEGHTLTISLSNSASDDLRSSKYLSSLHGKANFFWISELEKISGKNYLLRNISRELFFWKLFRKVYWRANQLQEVDFVFMPYMDYCLNAIGLLGSPFMECRWSGITMRPTFHYREMRVEESQGYMRILKRILFYRVLEKKTLKSVLTIDITLKQYFEKNTKVNQNKLLYIKDPAHTFSNTVSKDERFGFSENTNIILVYGLIDKRKNIFPLLDAIYHSDALKNWGVLVVGKQADQLKMQLAHANYQNLRMVKRLIEVDQRVSINIERMAFSVCDAVWVAYTGHLQMSGVLVLAGMNKKPSIASNHGLIGWYARTKGVAIIADDSQDQIVSALQMLCNRKIKDKISELAYAEFKEHTWENFGANLIKCLPSQ